MNPSVIADPGFYAFAVPAVLLLGISKGSFGSGLGVIAVPLMSMAVHPVQAAAILLPVLCVMDIFVVIAYRRSWHRENLAIVLPAAALGIGIGGLTFRFLDESWIRLLLGLVAVSFSLRQWLGRGRHGPAVGPSRIRGGLWGAVSGFTSTVAHAGGPPLSVYLLPQRLDRSVYVGTTVVFFGVVNYLKLIPYTWLGQFPVTNLTAAAILCPMVPFGILIGRRLHAWIDDRLFYRICYALLFAVGCKLLLDGGVAVIAAG